MFLRNFLKSKIHRALVTDASVEYEGSISIPEDLMEAADLLEGEKVLVASVTTGKRLETYVLKGGRGDGRIAMNGGAAHVIRAGELVTIMAFAWSETPVSAHKVVVGQPGNRIVPAGEPVMANP